MTEALPQRLKLYSVFFRDSLRAKCTAGSEPTRRWASKECVVSMELKAMGLGELYAHRNLS